MTRVAASLLAGWLLLTSADAAAQTIEWQAFSGGGTGRASEIVPLHTMHDRKYVAIGGMGDIHAATSYVDADSASSVQVRKFGTDGQLRWTTMFDMDGHPDIATSIGVDASGHVFVTCDTTLLIAGSTSVVTTLIKFENDGTRLWSRRIAQASRSRYLAVDAAGDVFVAAIRGTTIDLVKLSGDDATPLWQTSESAEVGWNPEVVTLTTDSNGDALLFYVSPHGHVGKFDGDDGESLWTSPPLPAGSERSMTLLGDDPIVAYDGQRWRADRISAQDGAIAWSTSFPPEHSYLRLNDVAADADGIYVTGAAYWSSSTSQLPTFARLDPTSGQIIWMVQHPHENPSSNEGQHLLLTEPDRLIAAGGDVFSIRREAGSLIWSEPALTIDDWTSVLVPAIDHSVLLMGFYISNGQGPSPLMGLRFARETGEASPLADLSRNDNLQVRADCWGDGRLLTDDEGGSYVASCAYDGSQWVPVLSRFDRSGRLAWQRQFPADDSAYPQYTIRRMSLGPAGDVAIVFMRTSNNFDPEILLLSRADGSTRWTREIDVPFQADMLSMARTPEGDLIVALQLYDSPTSSWSTVRIVRLDGTDGSMSWTQDYGNAINDRLRIVAALATPSGDVVLAGDGSSASASYPLLRVSSQDGALRWRVAVPFSESPPWYDLALGANGDVFTVSDDQLHRYSGTTGLHQWSVPLGWGTYGLMALPSGGLMLRRDGNQLERYSEEDGSLAWSRSVTGYNPGIGERQHVIACGGDAVLAWFKGSDPTAHGLWVVDLETGDLRWRLDTNEPAAAAYGTIEGIALGCYGDQQFRFASSAATPHGVRTRLIGVQLDGIFRDSLEP